MTDTIYDFIDSSPVGSAGDIVYWNDKCNLATYSPTLIQSLYKSQKPVTASDWAERGKVSRDYAIAHHNHGPSARRVVERHIEVLKNSIAALEMKKAYNCYSRAIRIEPHNPEYYFGRAEVLDWKDFKRPYGKDICVLSQAILPLPKLSPIWKKIRYGNKSLGRPGFSLPGIAWRSKYGNRAFYWGKRMMYSDDLMDCSRHKHITLKQGAIDDIATAISLNPNNGKYYFLQYNIKYGTSFWDRFNFNSDRFQLLLKAIRLDPANDDYMQAVLNDFKLQQNGPSRLMGWVHSANQYRYDPKRRINEAPPEYTATFVRFVTKTTKYKNRPPVKRKGPRPFWGR